jgi:hypothetical protein
MPFFTVMHILQQKLDIISNTLIRYHTSSQCIVHKRKKEITILFYFEVNV